MTSSSTRTPIKKQQNSSSSSEQKVEFRGIASEPKKVLHIAKQLDAFIEQCQANESTFGSWGEVKDAFETFSEERGTARVGMTWQERENGEVGGFQFFLKKDPEETISGKYLALAHNYHFKKSRDKQCFHPSKLKETLHVGEIEADLEELEELESLEELDDLEGLDTDDTGLIDELEEEKGEGVTTSSSRVIGHSPPSKNRSRDTEVYEKKRHINDVEHFGSRVAQSGNEVNGLTFTGMTIQALAALTAIISSDNPNKDQFDRIMELIRKAAEKTNDLSERLDGLPGQSREESGGEDDNGTQAPVQAPAEESTSDESALDLSQALGAFANKVGDRVSKLENRISSKEQKDPKLKRLEPLKLDDRDSVEERLNQIEAYLNKLNERLDYLDTVVAKLEKHLESVQTLNSEAQAQPIQSDRNPQAVVTDEQTTATPDSQRRSEINEKVVAPKVVESKSVEQASEESLTVTQTVEAIASPTADTLVRYACVTHEFLQNQFQDSTIVDPELFEDEFKKGYPLSATKALKVSPLNANHLQEQEQSARQVQIVEANGNIIFDATESNNQLWQVKVDEIDEADRSGILKLPQTLEAYEEELAKANEAIVTEEYRQESIERIEPEQSAQASEAIAQDFVEHLKMNSQLDYLFAPETADDERVAEFGDPDQPDYWIEAIEVKNGEEKGKFIIEIIDANDDTVFRASTDRAPGQRASIRQNDIPADYLNTFLSDSREVEVEEAPEQVQNRTQSERPEKQSSQAEL